MSRYHFFTFYVKFYFSLWVFTIHSENCSSLYSVWCFRRRETLVRATFQRERKSKKFGNTIANFIHTLSSCFHTLLWRSYYKVLKQNLFISILFCPCALFWGFTTSCKEYMTLCSVLVFFFLCSYNCSEPNYTLILENLIFLMDCYFSVVISVDFLEHVYGKQNPLCLKHGLCLSLP